MQTCPLGANSVAGNSLPINPGRTAQLLGFETRVANSFDAVASRDLVLRLLAALSIFGVTLSRLATDLSLWATAEFDFLKLPDEKSAILFYSSTWRAAAPEPWRPS